MPPSLLLGRFTEALPLRGPSVGFHRHVSGIAWVPCPVLGTRPAIERKIPSRDERAFVGREEDSGMCDVRGPTEPPERDAAQKVLRRGAKRRPGGLDTVFPEVMFDVR